MDTVWQHKRACEREREPEEEFSFLFNNARYLGIGLPGEKDLYLEKHFTFEMSRALPTALEIAGERFIRTLGRTHNRIRSPR